MNTRRIYAIFRKESKEALRDRRTLLAMIIIPIIILPVMMFLPVFLANPQRNPVKVAVIQEDHTSDSFVEAMRIDELRVAVLDGSSNITKLVQDGDFEVGVILPKNFSAIFESNHATATVTVIADEASARGSIAVRVVDAIITGYSSRIVQQRLQQAGLPGESLSPIKTKVVSVATSGIGSFLLAFLLPLFLGIYSVSGGIYFIMDTTAGEKERKTLEALLTMPATRAEILLGKFMVATIIALASTAFALIGLAVGASLLIGSVAGPATETVSFSLSLSNLALIGLASLLLAMTAASLEMLIAIFARSFKEAQNLISPLTIIVILPALAMQYVPEQTLRSVSLVPFLNSMLIIRNAVLNRVVIGDLAIQLGSALVYMAISLAVATRIFQSEKAMLRF